MMGALRRLDKCGTAIEGIESLAWVCVGMGIGHTQWLWAVIFALVAFGGGVARNMPITCTARR